MPDDDRCPHCKTSLTGKAIPREYIRKGYYSPGALNYRREIGVQIRGEYDGVLYWQCPDCGGTWHRFPEGDYRRERAEKYIGPVRD